MLITVPKPLSPSWPFSRFLRGASAECLFAADPDRHGRNVDPLRVAYRHAERRIFPGEALDDATTHEARPIPPFTCMSHATSPWACRRQNVSRLIHISGVGADPASRSEYIRVPSLGEVAVQKAFPPATILRSSVMFAVDGGFLSILEKLARSTPIIPLIRSGLTRLQPVHASDVGEAVYQSLLNPDASGKIYELGGPESYTMREISTWFWLVWGRSPYFISIPFALAPRLALALEFLPSAPLTVAQVDLLRSGSVPGTGTAGIVELGVTPPTLQDTISQPARTK
jgi:hypothetical protein